MTYTITTTPHGDNYTSDTAETLEDAMLDLRRMCEAGRIGESDGFVIDEDGHDVAHAYWHGTVLKIDLD